MTLLFKVEYNYQIIKLTIDFDSSLQLRISGSLTGTFDNGTHTDVFLSVGDVTVYGSAEFALVLQSVDVDTDGNGAPDLLDAKLLSLALTVDNVGIDIVDVASMTVTGELALARLTHATDTRSWTALKMGNVTVDAVVDPALATDLALQATLTIEKIDVNLASDSAAAPTDPAPARLDWNTAFDFDADGTPDLLNPGSELPTSKDLTIDFDSSLQLRISGSLTGTYDNGTHTDVFLSVGDVTIYGSAEFALVLRTVDVDTDGIGGADLSDATLLSLALTVDNVGIDIVDVATLTVSGELALARLTHATDPPIFHNKRKKSRHRIGAGFSIWNHQESWRHNYRL